MIEAASREWSRISPPVCVQVGILGITCLVLALRDIAMKQRTIPSGRYPTTWEFDDTLAPARITLGQVFASRYVDYGQSRYAYPIDYLHSVLDSQTLSCRDRYWVKRYNVIVDAFVEAIRLFTDNVSVD